MTRYGARGMLGSGEDSICYPFSYWSRQRGEWLYYSVNNGERQRGSWKKLLISSWLGQECSIYTPFDFWRSFLFCFEIVLPRLASNSQSSYLCLPDNWDYRNVPPCLARPFIFLSDSWVWRVRASWIEQSINMKLLVAVNQHEVTREDERAETRQK
jgi:hypothetical protein